MAATYCHIEPFLQKSLHAAGSLRANDGMNMGLQETVRKVVMEPGATSQDGIHYARQIRYETMKKIIDFLIAKNDLAVAFLIVSNKE